jgi:predicted MFS family arabinose efflux permease
LTSRHLVLSLLVDARSSWVATLPGLLIVGIGTGLFNPAVSAVALGSAPAQKSGLAAGVNDTFRHAGIAVGVAGFGALVSTGLRWDKTGPRAT